MRTLRRIVAVLAVGIVVAGASCSSTDDGGAAGVSTPTKPKTTAALVGPDAFAARKDAAGVVTINVHVPDEGQIEGTDLVIPFDEISTSTALPADRSRPLAVYCRSGNMSTTAVSDLVALGYTDIVELDGGFNAWTKAGRPLNAPTP